MTIACWSPGRSVSAALAAVLLAISVLPSEAQTLTTGVLSGRVVSAAGQPVPDVLLTLRDSAGAEVVSAQATALGTFRFAGLAPAFYDLTVERIGFAPYRLLQIEVLAEREYVVRAELTALEGVAGTSIDRVAPPAVKTAERVPGYGLTELGGRSRTLGEAHRFSAILGDRLDAEGLPGWFLHAGVDGVPFRAVEPVREGGALRLAFPASAFDVVQVVRSPLDVEWPAQAGALMSAHMRTGGAGGSGRLSAYGSSDVVDIGSVETEWTDAGGSAQLQGRLSERGAFSAGIDARREHVPVSSAWTESDAAAVLLAADAAFSPYAQAASVKATAVSAFVRADWAMGDAHDVEVGLVAASLPSFEVISHGAAITETEGLDLVGRVGLRSRLGASSFNEFRAAFTSSERSDGDDASAVPFGVIASEAFFFGRAEQWSSARDAHLRLTDAVHFRGGSHTFKLGGEVVLGGYRYSAMPPRADYVFGGVDEFIAGTGAVRIIEGESREADWSDRTYAAFLQDRFTIAGIHVTAGLRAEQQTLSITAAEDTEWRQLTGIVSNAVEEPGMRLSPRLSLSWLSGDWTVNAEGGIYRDRFDPLMLASWHIDDGTLGVRRIVGDVSWPDVEYDTGDEARRLTLLGSDFAPPRTLRAAAGVALPRIAGATVRVSGVVRRTDNLPRRVDLNLVPLPAGRDQHGRAIFGTLTQQGALLTATPRTSRRFTTYDEVAEIVTDAASDHWSATIDVERSVHPDLVVTARYSYSRTTDDWFDAARGGWLTLAPRGLDETDGPDWVEGTSDLDVPHSAAVAMSWRGPADLRLGGVYNMRSGRVFTPGFRPGVDVNGDGVAGNDPAFIDAQIPGMDALIGQWDCLRSDEGAFARRNGCRGERVHRLDLFASIPVVRWTGGSGSLRLEAIDLLESAHDVIDTALYLVDPAGTIDTDPVTRTVTLPLIVNERFGESLASRRPGRVLRLGFSINW